MSSELGTKFGDKHGADFGEIASDWAVKLQGIDKITSDQQQEWSSDLIKSLGVSAARILMSHVVTTWKRAGLLLPSKETLKLFSDIAIKAGLGLHTFDLLKRLHERSNAPEEVVTADATMDPLAIRAPQTLAQIFDMIKDFFGRLIERFNRRKGNLTGERTWHINHSPSRHSRLDGQTKSEDENFNYKGEEIYGPRPPGGDPANWSNCSCYLSLGTKNGKEVRI